MSETLLVTGATGTIGRMIVPALIAAGFKVRGHYAHKRGEDDQVDWRRADFRRSALAPGLDWRQTDFRENLEMDELVGGCDGIIHLAAELADPDLMERVNVEATEALVAASVRQKVRYFGLASSMVVYGSPRHRDIDEATPTIDLARPLQPQFLEPFATREYARTKLLAEQAVRRAAEQMSVDIFRIAKSADPERMLEAHMWSPAQKAMRLYGNTHYIHQRDCAGALVHLAKIGLTRTTGVEVYNIADDQAGTYAELLRYTRKHLGRSGLDEHLHVPLVLEMLKNALKYRTPSLRLPAAFARLRTEKLKATGFTPLIGYARALDMAIVEQRARSRGR